MGFWSIFSRQPKLYTGKVLSAVEVRSQMGMAGVMCQFGKQWYAQVDSKAVIYLAREARDELFKLGIPAWTPAATCTLAAANGVVTAEALFAVQAFNDPIANGNPIGFGCGDVWFHQDGAPFGQNHAVMLFLTQQGPVIADPQAPDTMRVLSDNERMTITQLRFL